VDVVVVAAVEAVCLAEAEKMLFGEKMRGLGGGRRLEAVSDMEEAEEREERRKKDPDWPDGW
jgi:hypothetical protein